jgi:hypothetical protein
MPARLPPFLPALLPSCPPADAPPLRFIFSLHTPWRWCNARTGPDCHAEAAKCGVCENRVRENRETTGFVATIETNLIQKSVLWDCEFTFWNNVQREETREGEDRGLGRQRERELQLWMRWKFGYNNSSTVVVRVKCCPNIWWRSWEEEECRGETVTWKKSVEKQ